MIESSGIVKKKLIIIICLVISIISSTIGYHVVSAKQMVDDVENIIYLQHSREEHFSSFGYTIDNPNIIVNPYSISPLTALILFETDEEVSVNVFIEGKDNFKSYNNTFMSSKKHCIPIYGLYANSQNKVIISYGDVKKEITIETDSLPDDFSYDKTNNSNELTFYHNDKYSYAIDQNNDIRWFFTKPYFGSFQKLKNGHFLFSNDSLIANQLFEIDYLGKVYHQYFIDGNYYGSFVEVGNSIFVLKEKLIEIDEQGGTVLNQIKLDQKYDSISFDRESNMLEFYDEEGKILNKEVIDISKILDSNISMNNMNYNIYFNNEEYKLNKGVYFSNDNKTIESKEKIFLIGYKKIDSKYLEYDVKIRKNIHYLQITGNFSNSDKVYVILDKFLDKKIYDLEDGKLIVNGNGLHGKYSIYLKINDDIYQTDYYVNF